MLQTLGFDSITDAGLWGEGSVPKSADTIEKITEVLKKIPSNIITTAEALQDLLHMIRDKIDKGKTIEPLEIAGRYLDPVCNYQPKRSDEDYSPLQMVTFQHIGASMQPLSLSNDEPDNFYSVNDFQHNQTLQMVDTTDKNSLVNELSSIGTLCDGFYTTLDASTENLNSKMMTINNESQNFTGNKTEQNHAYGDALAGCGGTEPYNLSQYLTKDLKDPTSYSINICNIIAPAGNVTSEGNSTANVYIQPTCVQQIDNTGTSSKQKFDTGGITGAAKAAAEDADNTKKQVQTL